MKKAQAVPKKNSTQTESVGVLLEIQKQIELLAQQINDHGTRFDKIDENAETNFNFQRMQEHVLSVKLDEVHQKLDARFAEVMTGIDGIFKKYDTLYSEYWSMKEQGKRRVAWYVEVGKKVAVPYPVE